MARKLNLIESTLLAETSRALIMRRLHPTALDLEHKRSRKPRRSACLRERLSCLLVPEHDVGVHPRCAPCRQPTGEHRYRGNGSDHTGDRHCICRLHTEQH